METSFQTKFLLICYTKPTLKDIVASHQKEQFLQNVPIEPLEIFLKNQYLRKEMLIGWMK